MRYLLLVSLLVLSVFGSAMTVERFSVYDSWQSRHYPGGKQASWVKKKTGADCVRVAAFYGRKHGLIYAVNYIVENSKAVIGPIFKNWPVLAKCKDGRTRIFPNITTCLRWGQPIWAVAGRKIPPRPNEHLTRQFYGIKGDQLIRVQMQGNRWDCQQVAKKLGLEFMIHMDGGSSLEPGVCHPSFILLWHQKPTQTK